MNAEGRKTRDAPVPAEGTRQIGGKTRTRFMTCGSVDDGKSTLIGRLLYDGKLIAHDQLDALHAESKKYGAVAGGLDFALLVDGLQAEREQGITIDVAYRYFSTERSRFVIADTPGHVQYTRNMVTAASTSDLAVLLVDARRGLVAQTRRHLFIVAALGIRHVLVAVNKIDLMDYSQPVFQNIVSDVRAVAERFHFETLDFIPVSALRGDNVYRAGGSMPWYEGPTLIELLDRGDYASKAAERPFRFQVQWVNRLKADFRGFAGTIASGRVAPGDEIVVAESGQGARIKSIVTYDGDLQSAGAGEAVTLTLDADLDISRGDVLCPATDRVEVANQFEARLIWLHEQPLLPGRPLLIKIGTRMVAGYVTSILHRTDIDTYEALPASALQVNDIGTVQLILSEPVGFERYADSRALGAFILIDRMTNMTVGAGMVERGLRRATNIHWQNVTVSKTTRSEIKAQRPVVLWFTGLSGAGKSTIANLVEQKLQSLGRHTYLLDGDNVRHGLNKDLGFTEADRSENIRRVAEVAKLMLDAGLITLVSLISPFRAERQMARALMAEGEFVEIHVAATLAVAEARDPKGLYAKARRGELRNFTGIDSPYEEPHNPELTLDTTELTADELAESVVAYMARTGCLSR